MFQIQELYHQRNNVYLVGITPQVEGILSIPTRSSQLIGYVILLSTTYLQVQTLNSRGVFGLSLKKRYGEGLMSAFISYEQLRYAIVRGHLKDRVVRGFVERTCSGRCTMYVCMLGEDR